MCTNYPMQTIEELHVVSAQCWYSRSTMPDYDSAKLCTFHLKDTCSGLLSAQDMFHDIMSELFEVVVDDVLIWGETKQHHDARLEEVLKCAQHCDLRINKNKVQRRKGFNDSELVGKYSSQGWCMDHLDVGVHSSPDYAMCRSSRVVALSFR